MRKSLMGLFSMLCLLVAFAGFSGCGSDDTGDADGDNADGDAVVDGDEVVDGDDVVDGDVAIDGDAVVDGDVIIDGDAVIDGDVVVDGDAIIDGDVVIDGDWIDGDWTDGDWTDGDWVDGDLSDGDVADNGGFWAGDDFESGNFNEWGSSGANYSAEVTQSIAADGSANSLKITKTVTNEHGVGLVKLFDAYQPCEVSVWVYTPACPVGVDYTHYFILSEPDDQDALAGDFLFFFISENGLSVNDGNGPQALVDCGAETWYEVKFELDWVNKTADVYVDDVLKGDDLSFKDTSVSAASRLELYNWTNGSVGYWDEIELNYSCD